MLSLIVHYKNKYPKGRVEHSESGLRVYDSQGQLRVALEKNGAGQLLCVSERYGALDRHDLSPIPKEARRIKLFGRDGESPRIGHSEEYEERSKAVEEVLKDSDGERVPSMAEYDSGLERRKVDSNDWKRLEESWKVADHKDKKKS
jgi:hypothetical protein